ncbi:U-box domain-containing protein 29 [Apostasia shenzhenica]|uniref:U-box domain-containing protein n=1 Tax=Apostasia shenzhenica TaxID=1088818 RepID=A0A2I0A807_9ASPA|nr:U-box domain-containing protein 29 [Apostasia shenzhenica]
MRRKSEKIGEEGGAPRLLRLDVRKPPLPPSFFRCPISLEVMRSPVSLCTGVTYDRSSIQRWLDGGNNTCPATMQPLPSTDLVPNLTLRRLIHSWSSSATADTDDDELPSLSDLARFLSDPGADDADKLRLLSSDALCPSTLASLFAALHENIEPAVTLISILLSLDLFGADRKRLLIAALLSNLDAAVSRSIAVLQNAGQLTPRIAAARVLEDLFSASSSDPEAKNVVLEKPDVVIELVRLIGETDSQAVEAGLRCLMAMIGGDSSNSSSSSSFLMGKRVRAEMVKAGGVVRLAEVLGREAAELPATTAEMAMRAMEAAAECGEGRAAICRDAERCVAAVMGRMMKVGNEGREAALAVLWSVCCAGGGDRRARAAAAAARGCLAKILLVMQGECSPASRRMAGDLLRIFRTDGNSSVAAAGYDSKTTHIMPY